jgi:N-acetyl-anhydromuramyl-L-alanine amidase AmpD
MTVQTRYMTDNDCYKVARENQLKGIMVHSTGCAFVAARDWFGRWNKPGVQKCVHAFVDEREIWNYLPYALAAWHSGTGGANPANIDHVAFEMCEPGPGASAPGFDAAAHEAYSRACWANAADYCAQLCRAYGWTADNITSHYEGYKKGIASNHSDPKNWFDRYGYSMEQFRAEVARKLKGDIVIMGKAVNRDRLIEWINANAYEESAPAPKPAVNPWPQPARQLHKGDSGDDVRWLQWQLTARGYATGIDGSFGPDCDAKLRAFQLARGLSVDGWAGSATVAALKQG